MMSHRSQDLKAGLNQAAEGSGWSHAAIAIFDGWLLRCAARSSWVHRSRANSYATHRPWPPHFPVSSFPDDSPRDTSRRDVGAGSCVAYAQRGPCCKRVKIICLYGRPPSPRVVKQVAVETGFPDQFDFCRVFRSVFGVSPTRFRGLR